MADEALDDDLLAQAIALSLAEAQAAGEETAPTTSGEKKRAHSPQGGDAAAESSRTPRPRTEARDLASQAAIQPHPPPALCRRGPRFIQAAKSSF